MSQILNLIQGNLIFHKSSPVESPLLLSCQPFLFTVRAVTQRIGFGDVQDSLSGRVGSDHALRVQCGQMVDSVGTASDKRSEVKISNRGERDVLLHVQTLRNFPREKLLGKVVMVRFDSILLQGEAHALDKESVSRAFSTIRYLCNAGAKVVLVSNWGRTSELKLLPPQPVADYLSAVLQLKVVADNGTAGDFQAKMEKLENVDILLLESLSKFKDESSNCSRFAKRLSSGVDIFVNDAFSESHKILASTVGVVRFCCASVAGFHFEYELSLVMEAIEITKPPYIAIIGGGNLVKKSAALRYLVSICDGLVFVGMMAFQFMNALGLHVSSSFVEVDAMEEASELIHLAHDRNITILFPKDFWCTNNCIPKLREVFPADGILNGWTPVDLGPISFNEISCLLSGSKKVLWIGPVKFGSSQMETHGASDLAFFLHKMGRSGCDITVVGNAACKAVRGSIETPVRTFDNAAVVWQLLKQRTLPGVAALDRAYPFELVWDTIFANPTQPLLVDIGSVPCSWILTLHFWAARLLSTYVKRYFISTNATSTFRSIVSSYPGDLILISIQCPNPDFNRTEHRRRMLQRTLIEAIVDLLATDGKVFLQSDIEDVAVRMKEQFLVYGKGKLAVCDDCAGLELDQRGWLKENPFGVQSDWEQHVVDRGAPMYRIMMSKKST